MSKRDLLLEIGLEEMPARFVTASMKQLSDKVQKWLKEKAIEFGAVEAFSTPRRLAILVKDVSESQKDIEEEAKGPAKKIALDSEGNWSKAALGFVRGQGMTAEDIYFKELKGIEYAHVNKFIKGQPTSQLLSELQEIISGMTFPKNMRWANQDLRFVRPIKWLIALFGNEVVPFSIADVETGRETKGHRFLGEAARIEDPEQYEATLRDQFVMANPEKRRSVILEQIKSLEQEKGWIIPVDEDLLEEVNNLVEYPTVLFGHFEEEFLELPAEVLITSMKEHQRYFPVKDQGGKLLAFFVTVRNGDDRHLEKVSKGNEKVLRARLSDAAFFFKEDQKKEIADALKKLDSIVYHEEIGTLAEKTARVTAVTGVLADALNLKAEKDLALRAAEIAKFDLVSHMVYEFPELQGYMGEKYALLKGEAKEVAAAINEHYMPRHADDNVPPSVIGAVVSIAEKIDTLASFFAIGVIPTGSQDPYALRRQASGVVQILAEKKWNISLEELITLGLKGLESKGLLKRDLEEVKADMFTFFKARVKHLLQEQQIRYDLIDAVLIDEIGFIHSLVERAHVLDAKKDEAGFKESLEALSRVMNIAVKCDHKVTVDPNAFENEQEKALYEKYQTVALRYAETKKEKERFEHLISLQSEIESYFENTMVMADDEAIRNNRLSLMKEISDLVSGFAAMNKIILS
ncbi:MULTISPECIES: glycine--tRNA ligase subunit beta [unclassified Peribacillus]|uniref:glycine--tRNA ligase subunit beta n=1 Tax=unclassified Peribacillus TaxID=2675266 RepID=UPI00191434FD|nr:MULTISPECIES: glycine--tRNA ligase subunit beta [unclassified Peribacillus]MBK5442589.1 glycine--tRNA ligase subunit beta [Peribacillus sp. TH24]MBK5462665.1 glycine--tRNA ligase subunit beta [Peribacillus sp. TH27]MBK5483997.1 glycine--tRNA ligase subunit beta [Peribacillus sp. TH16]MBK5500818.1 glycine--tRNA ligase subunit beta [Peribacillus sp. TH14]WMX54169.1 glycine--tRNA ligase subunit beta [Peribacillus sp. R9-11]